MLVIGDKRKPTTKINVFEEKIVENYFPARSTVICNVYRLILLY